MLYNIYCIFDQENAALVSKRDLFEKHISNSRVLVHLKMFESL